MTKYLDLCELGEKNKNWNKRKYLRNLALLALNYKTDFHYCRCNIVRQKESVHTHPRNFFLCSDYLEAYLQIIEGTYFCLNLLKFHILTFTTKLANSISTYPIPKRSHLIQYQHCCYEL